MDMRHVAFQTYLRELFERVPVPGNPDNPKKARSIERTKQHRQQGINYAGAGMYQISRPDHLLHRARGWKVSEKELIAIHTLIYG